MRAGKASSIQKLFLLVLTLILVCLVAIVMELRRGRQEAAALRSLSQTTDPAQSLDDSVTEKIVFAPITNRAPAKTVHGSQPEVSPAAQTPPQNLRDTTIPPNPQFVGLRDAAPVSPVVALPVSGGYRIVPAAPGISGKVRLVGAPPPERAIPEADALCGRFLSKPLTTRFYVVSSEAELANVVVYIRNAPTVRRAPGTNHALFDYRSCTIHPYVMGVRTNQELYFRNSDPVMHNIHATPKENSGFNFSQVNINQVNKRPGFARPEMFIRLKCDVHPWEFAYVSVFDHPFFAVTDERGEFTLPAGLPAGKYSITASHHKAGEVTHELEITDPKRSYYLEIQLAVPEPQQAAVR